MKIITYLILIILLGFNFSLSSQSSCNPYFMFEEGREWTIENYTAKDKYQGKQSYKILAVAKEGNKLIARVSIIQYDKKDDEILNDEIEFSCEDGIIKMDMTNYVPVAAMESFKNLNVEMKFKEITIPAELQVGQKLEDGGVTISVNGAVPLTMKVEIIDRKVESKENMTVPAGNFEAYKINSTVKFSGMGNRESKNIEYISKELGPIRT